MNDQFESDLWSALADANMYMEVHGDDDGAVTIMTSAGVAHTFMLVATRQPSVIWMACPGCGESNFFEQDMDPDEDCVYCSELAVAARLEEGKEDEQT
jgi:hypothetical protein